MAEVSGVQVSAAQSQPRRAADWYELFFDLVFVVVVAVSADLIEEAPSISTVLVFLLLLFPLWWAWVNLMITNNLYGTRFPSIGVLVIAAMPGPAAMAIAVAEGVELDGWLYASGAAWIRLVLLAMWLIAYSRKAISVSLWRPLVHNLGTAALWLGSVLIPAPYQYLVWAVAVAIEIALLSQRKGFAFSVYREASISHALERVGLFVVIVIGEAVYLAVTGLAKHPTISGGAAALFGFLICALLARAFFRWGVPTAEAGLSAARSANSYGAMRDVIMYLPFILVAALTLIAASIGIAMEQAGAPLSFDARMLLAAGIGGFYLANALVGIRLGRPIASVATLAIPGLVVPALACLLSGELAAWATLALASASLVLLDIVSKSLGSRTGTSNTSSRIRAAQHPATHEREGLD
ncbi:low temperature requirement protein A [Parafrigoribacterium mesophilum]|uniref:low temperature requirement protein A n=1 Tax=Parafrigoribacterium mesophilum TaxID=433646 RepID=UPI0031FDEEBC